MRPHMCRLEEFIRRKSNVAEVNAKLVLHHPASVRRTSHMVQRLRASKWSRTSLWTLFFHLRYIYTSIYNVRHMHPAISGCDFFLLQIVARPHQHKCISSGNEVLGWWIRVLVAALIRRSANICAQLPKRPKAAGSHPTSAARGRRHISLRVKLGLNYALHTWHSGESFLRPPNWAQRVRAARLVVTYAIAKRMRAETNFQ